MTAPAPLLEVRDLHAFRDESHILHGVDLDVSEGAVVALMGRNGVGKTTTLQAILGLVQRRGSVRFAGRDVTGLPTYELIRLGIGYVPEDRQVFSKLTVRENLRLAERPGTRPRYDLVHELFPRLRERGDQRAGTLSGGEQQMLALARVLLHDNRLLLIDEPTEGLAPKLVAEVVAALERIRGLSTVVLVEPNLAVVERLAEDTVVLDQGRVRHRGPVAGLLSDRELAQTLLGVSSTGGDR